MRRGRGNRATRKIHGANVKNLRVTMCELPISRRYVRHPSGGEPVNCNDCLRALVEACDYAEFLARAGLAKLGRNSLPIKKCRRCGEWDEFTSESEAHGICATCMAYANAPEKP